MALEKIRGKTTPNPIEPKPERHFGDIKWIVHEKFQHDPLRVYSIIQYLPQLFPNFCDAEQKERKASVSSTTKVVVTLMT